MERKHAKLYDSVSAQAQIAKLQDTGDMYTRKIELEKRRIEVRDRAAAGSGMRGRRLRAISAPLHHNSPRRLQDPRPRRAAALSPRRTPRRAQELDRQMEIMHKKIWEQRQKMGGINASRENNQAIAKQIQILENRLDKALKKYNANRRLRKAALGIIAQQRLEKALAQLRVSQKDGAGGSCD